MANVHVTEHDQLVIYREDEHTLRENFERFDRENPRVYKELVRLARAWKSRRPTTRCGIGMLFETMRWRLAMSTQGEPLKLNNNYRAFYARKIMDEHPDLDGLFELRRQRYDR